MKLRFPDLKLDLGDSKLHIHNSRLGPFDFKPIGLHTWTQDLLRHLHVLIACGGLDVDAGWVEPERNPHFLFPIHALSRVFRAKFLDALDAARQAGLIPHDPATTPKDFAERRRQLLTHEWAVYAKTQYC